MRKNAGALGPRLPTEVRTERRPEALAPSCPPDLFRAERELRRDSVRFSDGADFDVHQEYAIRADEFACQHGPLDRCGACPSEGATVGIDHAAGEAVGGTVATLAF